MLIAFQILLMIIIVLFVIGVIGDKDKDNRRNYTMVVCTCMASIVVLFIFY